MSAPLTTAGRGVTAFRRWVRLVFVGLAIVLLPLMAVAGGKGIAAVAAVLGIVVALLGLTKRGAGERVHPSLAFWAVLAFAFWALVTVLWSPHAGFAWDGNAVKILAGVLLYTVAADGVVQSGRLRPYLLQALGLGAVAVTLVVTCVDAATDYALTFWADPLRPGEDAELKRGQAEMNVGHGVTVAALLLPAACAAVFAGLRHRRGVAVLAIAGALTVFALAASMGRLWVGFVVLSALAIVTALALWRPRAGVLAAGAFAGVSVLFAPLVGVLARGVPDAAKAGLPFSWEHRLESWAFVAGEIVDAPLLGHGFDAARTYTETFTTRGFEMPLVSLHPHNAGLQIWLETGLVGAVLATVAIAVMVRAALGYVGKSRARAVAVAGFVTAATCVSGVSYGVWQEWWWASLFLCGAMVPVLLRDYS